MSTLLESRGIWNHLSNSCDSRYRNTWNRAVKCRGKKLEKLKITGSIRDIQTVALLLAKARILKTALQY